MRHWTWIAMLAVMFLIGGPVRAQDTGKADRLFHSHDVLDVTITAAFETLMDERPLDADLPGKLSYADETGATIEFDVGLRTRGRYRHREDVCPFAPLRLNFKKSSTTGTLFNKQDKLKLVTHCRNGSDKYEQAMFREYLAYRFFNELTPLSFRVRLLRIRYVDTENPGDERLRHGFVIEHRDRLAKRIKLAHVETKNTRVSALHAPYTNLSAVFQYFVANTDFSPLAGAPDDVCCHNGTLFGNDGGLLYAIPYDFDMAGLIDARYATPNPRLRIDSVRQRLYRGYCAHNEHLPVSLQRFRDQRSKFRSLIEDMPELSNVSRKSMLDFIRRFDRLIDDPRAVEKKIVGRCL